MGTAPIKVLHDCPPQHLPDLWGAAERRPRKRPSGFSLTLTVTAASVYLSWDTIDT